MVDSKLTDEWEKQEGSPFWKPEKADEEIIGKIVDIKDGMYGTQYVLEKSDKETIVLPSCKVLLARLESVQKGAVVKIIYRGEEGPKIKGHNPTKMFDVFTKKTEKKE